AEATRADSGRPLRSIRGAVRRIELRRAELVPRTLVLTLAISRNPRPINSDATPISSVKAERGMHGCVQAEMATSHQEARQLYPRSPRRQGASCVGNQYGDAHSWRA